MLSNEILRQRCPEERKEQCQRKRKYCTRLRRTTLTVYGSDLWSSFSGNPNNVELLQLTQDMLEGFSMGRRHNRKRRTKLWTHGSKLIRCFSNYHPEQFQSIVHASAAQCNNNWPYFGPIWPQWAKIGPRAAKLGQCWSASDAR